MSIQIITPNKTVLIENKPGVPLDQLVSNGAVHTNRMCAGQGSCRRCLVTLESGRFIVHGEVLEVQQGNPVEVLSCMTTVDSVTAVVRFEASALLEIDAKIDTGYEMMINLKTPRDGLGVAVDIGTTTVVMILVDLKSGQLLKRAAKYNQQIKKADDVSSRITASLTEPELKEMQRLLIEETLNPLLEELLVAHERGSVREIVLAGNTVMTHLLYGLSPASLGQMPFEPVMRSYPECPAMELGVALPAANLYAVPSISGYVGGDLTAGLLVSKLNEMPGNSLLIDIGTNGEMILNLDGTLYATATAAGPAFEGAGLTHGCRASAGAIERVMWVDGQLRYKTIGGVPAVGLCGSAVIEFLAELHVAGELSDMGRFTNVTGGEFPITDEISVSERDIAEVMKAKAAISAGIVALLELENLDLADLDRIVLAGGFARHLDLSCAKQIGLLPPNLADDQFLVVGNTSLAGAVQVLLDTSSKQTLLELMDQPSCVELNLCKGFQELYIDSLTLDTDLFD